MNTQAKTTGSTGSAPADRVVAWFAQRRRELTIGVGAVVLIGGGIWFTRTAQVRKETFAAAELNQVRFSMQAGNLQLAASDIARIVSTYGGTKAGQEANLLLSTVRLRQGDPALAATGLRLFLDDGPDPEFEGPAAGLLGAALEEVGSFAEAADAFERAADATPYSMIRTQYLLDLGRAATTARDTARAVAAYQRIIDEDDDAGTAAEARFRLSEIRKGT